jgi:transposase
MAAFPTAGHLVSWAGVCPGANESAGRVTSTKTRDGNRNLKAALGVAALAAARTRTRTSPPCTGASAHAWGR